MLIMENRMNADRFLERSRGYATSNNTANNNNNNTEHFIDNNIDLSDRRTMKCSDSSDNSSSNFWHAHVYGNPPRTPTPHLIANILGWNCTDNKMLNAEDEPLNLTTRDRSPDDGITSSAEPVLLNGDSNSSRECRTPRRDSPIKSNNTNTGKQLSRKNAVIKSMYLFILSFGSMWTLSFMFLCFFLPNGTFN